MLISQRDDKTKRFISIISEWRRLLQDGVLGFYQRCEVTEIVGFCEGSDSPFNVLSVLVLEESESIKGKRRLNGKRIILPKLKGYSFGLYQYHVNIQALNEALDQYIKNNVWQLSEKPLSVGSLYPVPNFFVPPDSTEVTPLNSVLKNNFWNGSHVFELFDNTKTQVTEFFENPQLLQDLSEEVQKYIPISFSKLSDRLGNILIQLPVTVIMCKFFFKKEDHSMAARLAAHPKNETSTEEAYAIITQSIHDGLITSYGFNSIKGTSSSSGNIDAGHMVRSFLWNQKNLCLLAATNLQSVIRAAISCVVSNSIEQARTIVIPSRDRKKVIEKKIPISRLNLVTPNRIGNVDKFNYINHIHNRIYNNERNKLQEICEFVQYGLPPKNKHIDAVDDLRYLVNEHGGEGAWLWDPYLDYYDIMEILFYCKHARSDLRALNDYSQISKDKYKNFNQWCQGQKESFTAVGNNYFELKFEFRSRREDKGFKFHDRFLIFPKKGKAACVWSLGTSINNMGDSHYILQKIDNGELIKDSFLQLWNELDSEYHIVWRYG